MPDPAETDPADAALVRALRETAPGEGADAALTPEELAERTGVPVALLDALARDGLLAPREVAGEPRYSPRDAEALTAGITLLEAGVPLDELLGLARRHDEAMRTIAEEAVDLFVRFVRDPIQGTAESEDEAGERLAAAFREMLPATGALVSHHFRRLLVTAAEARLTGADAGAEAARGDGEGEDDGHGGGEGEDDGHGDGEGRAPDAARGEHR